VGRGTTFAVSYIACLLCRPNVWTETVVSLGLSPVYSARPDSTQLSSTLSRIWRYVHHPLFAETRDWDQTLVQRLIFDLSPKMRMTDFAEPKLINYSLVSRGHRRIFFTFGFTKRWSDFRSRVSNRLINLSRAYNISRWVRINFGRRDRSVRSLVSDNDCWV